MKALKCLAFSLLWQNVVSLLRCMTEMSGDVWHRTVSQKNSAPKVSFFHGNCTFVPEFRRTWHALCLISGVARQLLLPLPFSDSGLPFSYLFYRDIDSSLKFFLSSDSSLRICPMFLGSVAVA